MGLDSVELVMGFEEAFRHRHSRRDRLRDDHAASHGRLHNFDRGDWPRNKMLDERILYRLRVELSRASSATT